MCYNILLFPSNSEGNILLSILLIYFHLIYSLYGVLELCSCLCSVYLLVNMVKRRHMVQVLSVLATFDVAQRPPGSILHGGLQSTVSII